VVGSLIQVLLPWSVAESGTSVDMTWLEVLWSRCYWLADWLRSEEDWWQSVVGSLIQVLLPCSVAESGTSVDITCLEADVLGAKEFRPVVKFLLIIV
jgi:hypothetical protein